MFQNLWKALFCIYVIGNCYANVAQLLEKERNPQKMFEITEKLHT